MYLMAVVVFSQQAVYLKTSGGFFILATVPAGLISERVDDADMSCFFDPFIFCSIY